MDLLWVRLPRRPAPRHPARACSCSTCRATGRGRRRRDPLTTTDADARPAARIAAALIAQDAAVLHLHSGRAAASAPAPRHRSTRWARCSAPWSAAQAPGRRRPGRGDRPRRLRPGRARGRARGGDRALLGPAGRASPPASRSTAPGRRASSPARRRPRRGLEPPRAAAVRGAGRRPGPAVLPACRDGADAGGARPRLPAPPAPLRGRRPTSATRAGRCAARRLTPRRPPPHKPVMAWDRTPRIIVPVLD
jgi:hypothetical protein